MTRQRDVRRHAEKARREAKDAVVPPQAVSTVAALSQHSILDAMRAPVPPPRDSWRERLWTAPAECRIGRAELLEAVGRPKSWLYRHTKAKAKDRIPHRKLDGELVFLVGEIRAWLRAREDYEMLLYGREA